VKDKIRLNVRISIVDLKLFISDSIQLSYQKQPEQMWIVVVLTILFEES